MPHIHTEPGQHDHTVTAYIVRDDFGEPKVMLHMHKKLARLLPVGGHIELDETPWSALAHELEEESGYRLIDLEVLQPDLRVAQLSDVIVHPQPFFMNTHDIPGPVQHFHSDTVYLLLAHGEPSGSLGSGESTDIRWLSASEAGELSSSVLSEGTKRICADVLTRFIKVWKPVPATEFRTDKIARS